MLRIKTQVGNNRVYTLPYQNGWWITMITGEYKMKSVISTTLHAAGDNHLGACREIQLTQQSKGE